MRCEHCGGLDRVEERHQCLSCGAPAHNDAADALNIPRDGVLNFEIRAERCAIETTSFNNDSQVRYIEGIRRAQPITLTVEPTPQVIAALMKLVR